MLSSKAEARAFVLEAWHAESPDYELRGELLEKLALVDRFVRTESVFSKNDLLDDIATEDIVLALAHAVASEVRGGRVKFRDGELDVEARMNDLKTSKAHRNVFVSRASRLLEKNLDDDEYENEKPSREKRIAVARRIAELENDLTKFNKDSREYWTTLLELELEKSDDVIGMTDRELEMLRNRPVNYERSVKKPLDPNRKGLEITKITKAPDGTLVSVKERVKADVFADKRNKPTMSLEEFGDLEMKEAMEREARQAQGPKETKSLDALRSEGLEDDEEAYEAATLKAREWDDWKDDHPKGAGVTNKF